MILALLIIGLILVLVVLCLSLALCGVAAQTDEDLYEAYLRLREGAME